LLEDCVRVITRTVNRITEATNGAVVRICNRHKLLIGESEEGVIPHYDVFEGNPSDDSLRNWPNYDKLG
jgi:hypothetical protein